MQVAKHSMKKKYVAQRIRAHESLWMKHRAIPESGQEKNARVSCMLENPGTCQAMDQYISGAGRHANSHGLADEVTEYWNTLESEEDCSEPELHNAIVD
jgi:hypothetical protein